MVEVAAMAVVDADSTERQVARATPGTVMESEQHADGTMTTVVGLADMISNTQA
jgi:hypothetical protein